ncbi:DUF1338 domain-containing protein [Halomonas elongata]|uniref:DUF1338 domain-containing protein n=1 Tax=Halomonas elongata TaxID=2746 RepID=UPI000DCEE7CD|nr:DUF1338 domain-containing protein [Halomonas elongata]RAW08837.1 DUF1338 domain-containing protein [Halomonas elongata]
MQREAFIQQLWLDYIHHQPDIGGLRLWSVTARAEYLTLLTLNHGPWAMDALLPLLAQCGYQPRHRYAMADRGLLVTLLATDDHDAPWLVLAELQLGTLQRRPRDRLRRLVDSADTSPASLPCGGRPWPMPSWDDYRTLAEAHPLAGWLAVMGTRVHHAGFDCGHLGDDIGHLDERLHQAGFAGDADRHRGVFPISPLLDYRFYATHSQRLPFADGDLHRVPLGGLALVQKQVSANQERCVELLLPHHTRCELG